MLVVIADTSPIRYLIQIGHVDLLQRLFATLTIPAEVARELADGSAPPAVQEEDAPLHGTFIIPFKAGHEAASCDGRRLG